MSGRPLVTEHHKKFLESLDQSNLDVWLVAMWLQSRGNMVQVNALHKAPTADKWSEFSDNGDLFIYRRQEVKALSADFTGLDDWPFGKEFFICAKESIDRSKENTEFFFYLNRAKTHIAVLNVQKTRKLWKVKSTKDNITGNMYEVYYCDPALVRFMSMYGDSE